MISEGSRDTKTGVITAKITILIISLQSIIETQDGGICICMKQESASLQMKINMMRGCFIC